LPQIQFPKKVHLNQFQTQKESLQKNLDSVLIALSFIVVLFCGTISEFLFTDINEMWRFTLNLYRLSLLLLIFACRESIIEKIDLFLYKILLYILLNHFFDRYFELNTWSFNDALTLVAILFEYIIYKIKRNEY
jgi:hypothetical protein